MKNYKQLTSGLRYQIYGLKQAGLNQTEIAEKSRGQQIDDFTGVQAQTHLGVMYAKGEGITRDAKQAVYWYQKAAEQGDADAQRLLNKVNGVQ